MIFFKKEISPANVGHLQPQGDSPAFPPKEPGWELGAAEEGTVSEGKLNRVRGLF